MIVYTTRLTPTEIRARLDKFMPVPWSITARKPWMIALGDLMRPTPRQSFGGTVGPGWFQLTFRPKERAFGPTLLGIFHEGDGRTSVLVLVSRMGICIILGDLVPLLFLVAGPLTALLLGCQLVGESQPSFWLRRSLSNVACK